MLAATGISDHIGWAELVTIGLQGKKPLILDRKRVSLVEQCVPSAPYHHEGLALPLDEVRPIIDRTRKSVEDHCRAALRQAKADHEISAIVLQESPMKRLPEDLADVLASYQITCAADGMMYRECLADVGSELGLQVFRYPRRSDEMGAAAEALRLKRTAVEDLMKEFGHQVGAPWRKEHQVAAASALRVLATLS